MDGSFVGSSKPNSRLNYLWSLLFNRKIMIAENICCQISSASIHAVDMQLKQPRHKMPVKPSSRPTLLISRLLGEELFFLAVNHVFAREEVSVERGPALSTGDDLVAEDHAEVEGDAQIAGDEVLVVKLFAAFTTLDVHEDVKVLEDGDDNAKAEGEVGAEETKGSHIVHLTFVDALGPPRLDEVYVRHKDGDPGQDAEDGD